MGKHNQHGNPGEGTATGDEEGGVKLPDTLAIAMLLFPGFLSERVSEYFSTAPKLSDVQLVAAALAATVINLLLAMLLSPRLRKRHATQGLPFGLMFSRVDFLIKVFAISIVTGLVWAWIDSNNLLFRIHVSERTSRADPWETALHANARRDRPHFVRVVTKDVGTYHGNPLHYSQGGSDRTLVLDLAQRETATEPMRCVPVGADVHGRVFIASDQILAVEFRPKILVGGKCEYRCDIPPDSTPCKH